MKLSEILAKLGIKVEDEVDLGQQAAGNPETAQLIGLVNTLLAKMGDAQASSQVNQSNADVAKLAEILQPLLKQEQTPATPYAEGFYDSNAGTFDLSKISDTTLRGALEDFTNKQAAKETQRIIDAAYEAELAKHNLAIDKEVFRKVIDLSGVTVKDGKAAGVEEAFNALNDKGVYKAQPANPLNSGFKPMENVTNNTGNLTGGAGLYAAAQMDAEIQK